METSQYQRFADIDDRHWWFIARRKVVEAVLKSALKDTSLPLNILDIGSGSGGMIPLLSKYGKLVVTEPDVQQLQLTQTRYAEFTPVPEFIHGGWEALDMKERRFDLLTAFDVLEHCRDDRQALSQWKRWLKDDGRLFLTVPAFGCLWGRNDELSQHYRRYTRATLLAALAEASFVVEKITYMNALMFVPVWISRNVKDRIERLVAGKKAPEPWDFGMPPALINSLLEKSYSWESKLLPGAELPLGTSLLCIARACRLDLVAPEPADIVHSSCRGHTLASSTVDLEWRWGLEKYAA